MPRRTSPHQLQAFLRNLAATGNVTLAAEQAGLAKSGLFKRKARDPAFAASCAAALAEFRNLAAHPEQLRMERAEGFSTYAGMPQLRRCTPPPGQGRRPGRLTQAAIETILATLAATANVRLAAAAAGVAHSSVYRRARRDEEFARAMRQALEIGYDQLEQQVLRSLEAALGCAVDSLDDDEYPPLDFEGRGTSDAGGGALFDPAEPAPNPKMREAWTARNGAGTNITFMRALWLLKFHRDVRLPEGWRFARDSDRPRRGEFMGGYGRKIMTDDEVMEELKRRMAFLRTQPDDED